MALDGLGIQKIPMPFSIPANSKTASDGESRSLASFFSQQRNLI
ncbi:MAG: hypothetical protein AAFX95_05375 [Cyanobacteria bacterium J06639_16]